MSGSFQTMRDFRRCGTPYEGMPEMYAEKATYPMDEHTAVRRPTQTEDQCNDLEKALASLEETARRLEDNLSKVLRPEMDDRVEAPNPEEILVPLADALRSWVKQVRRIDNRLGSLINRLEL